jgi:signal transduction histidine kinase
VVAFREPTAWDRYGGYIVAVVALLLLQSAMIGGLLLQRARRRQAEAALTVKEADLRWSYEQTRSLAGRLLTAQEAERARIARELHDDVSEGLAALSLEVQGLKNARGLVQGDALRPTLAALQQGIAGVADRIRTLSHELHPEIIHHVGLVAALASHCQEVQGRHGLPVTFAVRDDGGLFSPDAELCLFRIAQEVLRNSCKHARAHAAHVTLGCNGATVELSIEDDGVGFDLARARQQDGLGLLSIDERVRLLNGSASIETAPGAGTRVRVRVPRAATSGRPS